MTNFHYQDPFPLGPDPTEYEQISSAFVSTEQVGDREILKIDPSVETEQIQSLERVREARDSAAVSAALEALRRSAADGDNVMPALIHAAKTHCSVGETVSALADVYGRFEGGVGW